MTYKVLGIDRRSFHGGSGVWTPGRRRSVRGPLKPCVHGIHYCRRDQLVHWFGPAIWTFEDLTPDETIDAGDKMVTRAGRIVERVETWNETTARLFAADCAEAVLLLFERDHPNDDRTRKAIEAARLYARGEIDMSALSAARSAAWSAADSAARSSAWSAARSAAWSAADSAGWSSAWSAARSAAWSAADSAGWSAADSAGWSAQTEILFDYLEGRRQ